MEKINELQQEYATKRARMVIISKTAAEENRVKSEDETTEWNSLEKEMKQIKEKVENLKFLEEAGKTSGETKKVANTPEVKTVGMQFKEAIQKAKESNGQVSFNLKDAMTKAAIATTTDANLINKADAVGLKTLKTPGKDFLTKLGVQIHTGLTSNLPLPHMGEIDSSMVGEGVAISEFAQAPAAQVLVSGRVAKKKSFNVEFLAQSDESTLQGILEDMLDMPYRAIVYDLFDASIAKVTPTSAGGYNNVTKLPQNVPFEKKSPAFVATYSVAGTMKGTARLTNQGPIWEGLYEDGVADGYKAYAHSGVNAKNLIFGDWSHAHVGVWQEPTILIDPLAERDNGQIKFIVEAQMDSGIGDWRAFRKYDDASIA